MSTDKNIKTAQGQPDGYTLLETGPTYHAEFDENNENGIPKGTVTRFQIGDLILESKFMEGASFKSKNYSDIKCFEIEGKVFPALSVNTWVGNMIWNAYILTEDYAELLINHLMKSGNWTAFEGPATIYDKFENGDLVTKEDLRACF